MSHANTFAQMVDDARQRVDEIDIDTLHKSMQDGEAFTLVDVREESEWKQGHLPGAVHISKGLIEFKITKVAPDLNTTLVLYCGGGSRSLLAGDNLQKMGYTNVCSLAGGWHAWQAQYTIEMP